MLNFSKVFVWFMTFCDSHCIIDSVVDLVYSETLSTVHFMLLVRLAGIRRGDWDGDEGTSV